MFKLFKHYSFRMFQLSLLSYFWFFSQNRKNSISQKLKKVAHLFDFFETKGSTISANLPAFDVAKVAPQKSRNWDVPETSCKKAFSNKWSSIWLKIFNTRINYLRTFACEALLTQSTKYSWDAIHTPSVCLPYQTLTI